MAKRTKAPDTELWAWIKPRALKRGLTTNAKIASAFGISTSTLNDIRRADIAATPQRETRRAIIDALKLSARDVEELDRLIEAQAPQAVEPVPMGAPARPNADPLAGRWQKYAERYWRFRASASAALHRGVPEAALDAASDELGEHRGEGPSEEDCERTIAKWDRERAAQRHGRDRVGVVHLGETQQQRCVPLYIRECVSVEHGAADSCG